ncbi:MAG: YceI family protein [Flavobacteriales bacterium]|nr:YceI family protein [Flavobacteriales bacterium]
MKIITIISTLLILGFSQLSAQVIYITDSSMVSFFSKAPVEDIEAFNTTSSSLLNVAKSELVFRIPMTGFQFEKPLMQEHFNENYMETEKYPHATFKGKFSDTLDLSKDTIYNLTVTGIMKMHGRDHAHSYNGTIESKSGVVTLKSEFKVHLVDHKIKIPKVVVANIAEVIDVKVFFQYKPYEKKK